MNLNLSPVNIYSESVSFLSDSGIRPIHPCLTQEVMRKLLEQRPNEFPDDINDILDEDGKDIDADLLCESCKSGLDALFGEVLSPVMLSFWPVKLGGGAGESIAAKIYTNDLSVSLCYLHCDYYLAMSGGGTDLSWHLAGAYVLCGRIPPLDVLAGIARSNNLGPAALHPQIVAAYTQAIAFLRREADNMEGKQDLIEEAIARAAMEG